MKSNADLDIFLVAVPGTEDLLRAEAVEKGFRKPVAVKGGVTLKGGWPDVWRANLEMRGASRVLVRIGSFRVSHLAQLDKQARKFPWDQFLRVDVPVRVEASCRKSKIYHAGAVAERIAKAIQGELGAPVADDADVIVKVRIDHDQCTLSIDSSGEALHKRGHKEAVNKAPLRETLASLFLRACGYKGKEPVLDPMCGSGTFVIEAAEIAARLRPGRSRHFAFEQLATFDGQAWLDMKAQDRSIEPELRFYGFDRDAGAVEMSCANAERAGVDAFTHFTCQELSELAAPDGEPGLVMINPPYGDRIGDKKALTALYRSLGETLKAHFPGWRVGLVTTTDSLAKATVLPFVEENGPISHGGLRVKVYRTDPL